MKKWTAYLLLVLFYSYLVTPVLATESYDAQQAILDVHRDFPTDSLKAKGFALGSGVFSFLMNLTEAPQVPVGRLMGKSPAYVTTYSNKSQTVRKTATTVGCVIGCIVVGAAAGTLFLLLHLMDSVSPG